MNKDEIDTLEWVKLSCKYNRKIMDDKCYSVECILNNDSFVQGEINKKGCVAFKVFDKEKQNEQRRD